MIVEEKDIICNKCGQSLFDGINLNGLEEAECYGGPDSKYLIDTVSYSFSVCEKCLVEYMDTFKIPPTTEEYNPYDNYLLKSEKKKNLMRRVKESLFGKRREN